MVETTGALTALLITKEGTSLAEAGDTSYMNATAMAALVAGMFSATREVARLVGEEHFSLLLQQGENRHIHIGLVTNTTMLVVIFEDYQRIGRVRHEARKTTDRLLRDGLAQPERARPHEDLPTEEFKEVALNLIDRIFVAR
jgi:predicted regulator of Ras-like GTPase activity (Roadblock/LC7/MglB family)